MEKLMEPDFIGIADYIDSQDDWKSPEWKILNREFYTVLVDDVLGFLDDYYLPL
jgi:hypothetical protein